MKRNTLPKFSGPTPETPDSETNSRRISRLEIRLQEMLLERDRGLPIWIRSPKSGSEHYTGFSRAKLYALVAEGSIRSTSIKDPGAIKGTRLFELASILSFIEKCEAAGISKEVNP